jgi:hypothetical protein
MKLRYETGLATLIQFIVIGLLNLFYAVGMSIDGCVKGTDCGSGTVLNIVYFVLLSIWFIIISVVGYAAQDRRSKRLSQLLIAAEGSVALVALFNAKHHADFFGMIISIVDLVFAIWIITLAFRLMRSGGGRIRVKSTSRTRPRRRPTPREQL